MSNFDAAIDATAEAYNSANSAMNENDSYMQSLTARLNLLKAQFVELVTGDGGLSTFIKLIIDAATKCLEFANSGVGKLTLAMVALSVAITTVNKYGEAFAMNVLGLMSQNMLLAIASGQGLSGAFKALTADVLALSAAEKTSLIILAATAIALGIYGIVKAVDSLSKSIENQTEKLNEAQSEYDEAKSSVESIQNELAELKKQIDEINELKLQTTDREELQNLQAQTNELKSQETILRNQLAIQLQKEASAQKELEDKAKELKSSTNYDTYTMSDSGNYAMIDGSGTIQESFESGVSALTDLYEKYSDVNEQIEILEKNSQQCSEEYADLTEKAEMYQEAIDDLTEGMSTNVEAAEAIVEAGVDTDGSIQNLLNSFWDLIGVSDKVDETIQTVTDDESDYSEETDYVSEVVSNLSDSLDEVSSAYDALSSAVEEYNENGALSVDTLTSLLENYPQYIQYLYDENGEINLNSDALQTLAEARKADALQQVAQAEAADLQAYAEGNLNEVSELGQSILTAYQSVIEGVGDKAQDASGDILELATYVQTLNNTISGGNKDVNLSGLEALKNGWDSIRKSIADTDTTVNKYSSSSSSAASSSSDAWKEAFEEEKDALDHLLAMEEISEEEYYKRLSELNEKYFGEASGMHEKYLEEYQENEEAIYKGLVSAYKDKVEEEKDAALDAIDDVIDALEKEKDAALDAIDDQIDALKKAQEDALDAIDAEIKALEKAQEAQHDYYQEKIDALEKAHDLQEQINQLEEYENQLAQAKATKVWVMKDGQFQLAEDESSVSTAEQQLSDYKDEMDYEQQLQELQDLQDYWDEYYDNLIEQKEEYRDYIEEYYESQIEALEEYRDQVEEQYEAEIEALEEQKEALEEYYDEMLENYKSHVDSMMEEWSSFISESGEKYSESLAGLSEYVSSWNALVSSMATPTTSSGGSGVGASSHNGTVSLMSSGNAYVGAYASGYGSAVKDSEIALVGESPNTEMLIGSKINTGVVTRLQKGSGVVNAESTKTLAGILNSLGKNSYVGGGNNSTTTQNFSFGSISLPNVTDGNSFVEALKNTFSSYTIQYANAKA